MVKLNAITINKTTAYKWIGIQLIISVAAALIMLLYSGVTSAGSALMGGLIYILPHTYFVRCAFRGNEQRSPHFIVRWFYIGEAGKFVLTAVLFTLYFAWVESFQVMVLFTMYILMIIVNQAGLLLCGVNGQKSSE